MNAFNHDARRLPHTLILWLLGLVFLAVGTYLDAPYGVEYRNWALPGLVLASGLGALASHRWTRSVLLIGLWMASAIAPVGFVVRDIVRANTLLSAPAEAVTLAPHFIIGFMHLEDVEPYVRKGLIGGVFITQRNVEAEGAEGLRAGLAYLQAVRRQRGEPPLIVATDQEGGPVSRLSPPLPYRATLASLPGESVEQRAAAAKAYGLGQGAELAAFGVNVNLSPVVDVRRDHGDNPLDFHSRIEQRAISDDPDEISTIALAYGQGLRTAGVWPTLKHFPGLGRVREDTHHFPARIETPLEDLERTDWRPFRHVLSNTDAVLMVGHANVEDLDPDTPAALSRPVINDVLRKDWGFEGPIITDDLTMGPIYWRGLCASVVDALNAGVDLLLVSYDTERVPEALYCAQAAYTSGRLDETLLRQSHKRLSRITATLRD